MSGSRYNTSLKHIRGARKNYAPDYASLVTGSGRMTINYPFIGRINPMHDEVIRQQIYGSCSLYYVIIGSMYNVLQSAMVEAREVLKNNKKLYRQQIKRDINSAFAAYDKWNGEMKRKLCGANRYQLWLDISDSVDEKLRPDVQKLFYSIDRWLLKYDIPDHTLKAHMQTVVTLIDIFIAAFDVIFDKIREKIGFDVRSLFKGANFRDIAFYWERASKPILVTNDASKHIDFKDSKDCMLAVNILLNKIGSEDLYNDAGNEALKLNKDSWADYGLDKTEREILKHGGTLTADDEQEEDMNCIQKLKERFAC